MGLGLAVLDRVEILTELADQKCGVVLTTSPGGSELFLNDRDLSLAELLEAGKLPALRGDLDRKSHV